MNNKYVAKIGLECGLAENFLFIMVLLVCVSVCGCVRVKIKLNLSHKAVKTHTFSTCAMCLSEQECMKY